MKNRIFNLLKFLIGWPLSIVALFFIGKLVAPKIPSLVENLNNLSFPLLGCAVIAFLIYYFIRGYIWKRLIRQTGHDITFKESNFIWASSELKRYIPGNIWSFLGRAVMLTEKGLSKKDIASTTIIEIEMIVLGAAAVCLLAMPFLANYVQIPSLVMAAAPVVLALAALFYLFHSHFKLKHFILPAYPPSEILLLLCLNTFMYLSFGLGYFFTFASFTAIDPNLIWQLVGVSLVAYLIGYLSIITPSGFGVREGVLLFALSKIMSEAAAGFLALFSRLILILSELVYVAITYLWHSTKLNFVSKIEKWVSKHVYELIVFFLFLIYSIYFTTITFLRYDFFYAGRFDLGNMAQTVWNTTQGRIFMLTDSNGTEIVSRLSVHADFILVLLAPFYALWSNPKVLLLIQTIVLAAGCFFVYFIAQHILKNKNLSLILAFLYLLNPAVQRTNIYDFHAVTLATTFLLGAYYFFMKKQYKYFLTFAVLAGICKEQIWAIIGLFGVLLFFQHKQKLFGAILFVSGILISYLLIAKAIPHALGSEHFALSYLSEFGSNPAEIIKNMLFSPDKTLATIFQQDRIDYLKQILSPMGYLSLLSPVILMLALPELAISLLSNNPQLHQIYYQYSASLSPFIFIAAIYGINLVKNLVEKTNSTLLKQSVNIVLIIYLLASTFTSAYRIGPLPGAQGPDTDMLTKQYSDRAFVDEYINTIDKNLSVAASNNIGSHFSDREKIFVLPLGIDKADVLVFLLINSEYPQSLEQQKQLVEELRYDPNFVLEVEKNNFYVFKRVKITGLDF